MDTDFSQIKFDTFKPEHAAQVARLHVESIPTGYISSLGIPFATVLYKSIAQSHTSFGLVAEENGKLLGFIIFTPNLTKLYKSTLLKGGLHYVPLIIHKVFSLSQLKNMFETLFYPRLTKKLNLPPTGLISLAVAEEARGKRLGTALVQKGLAECTQRGIEKVRVLVGADNKAANALYRKYGFEKVIEFLRHNRPSIIYVVDLRKNQIPAGADVNNFAQFLKQSGAYVLTVDGVDWYEYSNFMLPAYLPHCRPDITPEMAEKVVRLSGRPFARWSSKFGEVKDSQWWYVLKRGRWSVEDIKNKKKRWMIREGKKHFTVRPLTFEEVLSLCPKVAQLAAARYKSSAKVETKEILERNIKAAQQVAGVLEYIGCFYGDMLVSFSENYIQNNAVWLSNIRHDPAFLKKYSSYALMDRILDYYLNQKKMDHVLDGNRSIHHRTEIQEHLIGVFGFTKEYAVLDVRYSTKLKIAVKSVYPFRNFFWMLADKWINTTVDNISALLKQEYIRSSCAAL